MYVRVHIVENSNIQTSGTCRQVILFYDKTLVNGGGSKMTRHYTCTRASKTFRTVHGTYRSVIGRSWVRISTATDLS